MNILTMESEMQQVCTKCRGKCCHDSCIFVTAKEKEILNKILPIKTKKEEHLFLMYKQNKACPFLIKGKGCSLKEELKPVDCTVFPLYFTVEKGRIKFWKSKDCHYYKEIPTSYVKSNITSVLKKLKSWSKKEKQSYSNIVKKYSGKTLFEI
jgi:Fe-S-cluster containining protein